MQKKPAQLQSPQASKPRRELLAARALRLYDRPGFLFLVVMVSIFAVEALVMVILERLPAMPFLAEAILDAFLLSLIVSPILFFFSLKPLEHTIRTRETTEIERQKALEFDRMKGELISTAAHELLTPLASVKGYVELLQADAASFSESEKQEFLAVIQEKADILQRIIDDMLDLSRLESGRPISLRLACEDLVPLVRSTIDNFRLLHPRHRFETSLPDRLPPLLLDRVRIGQVLGNLLGNAVKYSPAGSAVEVLGQLRDAEVLLTVKDAGIGMTPEQLAHVFEKFYRADTSDTAKGGLGLGMTIARAIVESHGGHIWVESEPGSGTTVRFTLPLPKTDGA